MPYIPPIESVNVYQPPILDLPVPQPAEPVVIFYYKGSTTHASVLLFIAASATLMLAGAVSRHLKGIIYLFCSVIKYGASFAFSRSRFESMMSSDEPVEIIASAIESTFIFIL